VRTERPNTVLAGRYVLDEELGHGVHGSSWRATDTKLARRVVVRLLEPSLADDPVLAERLTRETRSIALVSHPSLARLLDVGTDRGAPFLVREHVDGRNLRDLLKREGTLSVERAVALVVRILDALAEAHRCGVLHLAVTPENVVVSEDGSVRVTDAGLARAVSGESGDVRVDVRAAGALLFLLLTGRAPSEGSISPRALRRDVPRNLDAVVARSLAGDPATGYATAAALADALRDAAGLSSDALPSLVPQSAHEPAPWPAERSSVFRTWLAVPMLVAALAALAVVVGLSFGELELGGPVGIRLKHPEPSPTTPPARTLRFVSARAFDPFGDQSENDSGIPFADDGDLATVWKSENYFDGRLHKPGVGILFDLGRTHTVTGFRLQTPWPGFTFRVAVGNDPTELDTISGPTYTATSDVRETIAPAQGRYVLLWCTSVVPTDDGNRIVVGEFHVQGE